MINHANASWTASANSLRNTDGLQTLELTQYATTMPLVHRVRMMIRGRFRRVAILLLCFAVLPVLVYGEHHLTIGEYNLER